jgi:Abortive infection C-terminus
MKDGRPFAALAVKVEEMQNMLLVFATGGGIEDAQYRALRGELLGNPIIEDRLPGFLRSCRDSSQFWEFIKAQFAHYRQRREFIWDAFRPTLDFLEEQTRTPGDLSIAEVLGQFSPGDVQTVWARALERRERDPEGAITLARTLLEEVCKHILEDFGVPYERDAKLPTLYRLTSERLNLAPSQHEERVFQQILGGCQAVVEGLGAARNRLGDSHGKGKRGTRPGGRHARLAVNLAGTMAAFLVETWEFRKPGASGPT